MTWRLPAWATGIIGIAFVVALWWVLADTVFDGGKQHLRTVPTPAMVIVQYGRDGLAFYLHNFSVTLKEAGIGYAWGNGIALVLSALVLVVPRLEGLVTQIATITYCLPIVAIGGIAVVVIQPPDPGHASGTAVLLSAMSVFFTTVVGSQLGLKAADRASLDVVSVYGGSRLTQLVKVRVIAALPQVLYALQIAIPAAFLGSVLGEFFGKVEYGVGPTMIAAQQNLASARLWGIGLAIALVSVIGFLLVGLVSRVVTPWSRGR